MKISQKDWQNYIARLRKINEKAAEKVANYMQTHDCSTPEGVKQLIDYAHAVATKYGEGSAELSCQMLDAVAEASSKYVPAAEPAATATYAEIARTIYGTLASTRDPHAVGAAVGRSVKLASVDTLQQNALRDGAEWAWIPAGDTCPFCLMLASRGWVRASKKAIKNGHADHIHNNCDCTYCVRYDGETTVEGYEPEKLYEQYLSAGDTPRERLNALSRRHYAANKDYINAQKRAAYAKRAERQRVFGKAKSIYVDDKTIQNQDYRNHFRGLTGNSEVDDRVCNYSRQILQHRSGTYQEDLILLDADTGKHILSIDTGGKDNSVTYDERAEAAIRKAHEKGQRILAIHNHPNSLPPTLDDGVSAYNRGYDMGVVVCHDGTVYTYTPSNISLTEEECTSIHNAIAYQIKTGAHIDDVWYNMLSEFGMTIQRR